MKIKRIMKICLFTILSFIVINTFTDDVYATVMCRYEPKGLLTAGFAHGWGDRLDLKKNDDGSYTAVYVDAYHGTLAVSFSPEWNYHTSVSMEAGGKIGWASEDTDVYCRHVWEGVDDNNNNCWRSFYFNIGTKKDIIKCNTDESCCPKLYASATGLPLAGPPLEIAFSKRNDDFHQMSLVLFDTDEVGNHTDPVGNDPKPCDSNGEEYKSLITWAETEGNKAGNRIDDILRSAQDKIRTAELDGGCLSIDELDKMIDEGSAVAKTEKENFHSRWENRLKKVTCALDDDQKKMVVYAYTSIIDEKTNNYIDYLRSKIHEYEEKGCITEEEEEELEKAIEEEEKEIEELIKEIDSELDKMIDELIKELSGLDCKSLISGELLEKIRTYMKWIRVVVPILLIVLGTVDFAKAALLQEKDDNNKAFSTFIKRCVVAVAIFFLPLIISLLVKLYNRRIDDVPDGVRLTPMDECLK